ncbi:hypothetical protein D3C72_1338840 [compost metagenome]
MAVLLPGGNDRQDEGQAGRDEVEHAQGRRRFRARHVGAGIGDDAARQQQCDLVLAADDMAQPGQQAARLAVHVPGQGHAQCEFSRINAPNFHIVSVSSPAAPLFTIAAWAAYTN